MGYIMRYCGVSNDFLHGKRGQTRLPPCFCSASTLRIHTLPPPDQLRTQRRQLVWEKKKTRRKRKLQLLCVSRSIMIDGVGVHVVAWAYALA